MSDIGILEYDYGNHYDKNGPIKGAKKERRYTLPMFVPGSAEFTNMIKKQLDEHPELAMFFERMTYLPLTMVTPMVPPGGAGIGMHVIPVEKAIEMENGTMDIEHISYWLKSTKDTSASESAPAVTEEPSSAKVAATAVKSGVSASAIWLITAVKRARDAISPMKKQCKFSATQRRTVLFIKSPTSTARTRSLQSATATSTSATRFVLHNFSTPPTCREAHTLQRLKRQVRSMRQMRRVLPRRRSQTRTKTLHKARRNQISQTRTSRQPLLGPGQVG